MPQFDHERELASLKRLLDQYVAKGEFDPKLFAAKERCADRVAQLEYERAALAA